MAYVRSSVPRYEVQWRTKRHGWQPTPSTLQWNPFHTWSENVAWLEKQLNTPGPHDLWRIVRLTAEVLTVRKTKESR